jgi:hypothetical protein
MRSKISFAVSCLAFSSACSDETTTRPTDLPAEWEAAQRVKMFSQGACTGSAYDPNVHETLDVTAESGSVNIAYHNAHFRCSQTVEGFVRADPGTLDVLVQPVDMNPATIAKCDCLYEITIALDAGAGTYTVQLSRRWDHKSGSDGVTLVGSASVSVP